MLERISSSRNSSTTFRNTPPLFATAERSVRLSLSLSPCLYFLAAQLRRLQESPAPSYLESCPFRTTTAFEE